MKDILEVLLKSNFELVLLSVSLVLTAFLIYYMKFYSKYKNFKLSTLWCICAVISPFFTGFAFYIKSKKLDREALNSNETDEKLQKKAKILGVGFWLLRVVSTFIVIINAANLVLDVLDVFEEKAMARIGTENEYGQTAYYDKQGNEYSEDYMVLLYDENGTSYVRAAFQDVENDNALVFCYLDGTGEKYDSDKCFVDENGYFVLDKNEKIVSEEKSNFIGRTLEKFKYLLGGKYYDYPLTDEDGNVYYFANSASYDKNGELIVGE